MEKLIIDFDGEVLKGQKAVDFMDYWHGRGKWSIEGETIFLGPNKSAPVESGERGNQINGEEIIYSVE